jgi:hypothetical protein
VGMTANPVLVCGSVEHYERKWCGYRRPRLHAAGNAHLPRRDIERIGFRPGRLVMASEAVRLDGEGSLQS